MPKKIIYTSGLSPGLIDLATYNDELDGKMYGPYNVIKPKNFRHSYLVFKEEKESYTRAKEGDFNNGGYQSPTVVIKQ